MKRWRGAKWRVRWSRQMGSARNKSDGNKTRDGEEKRDGEKELLTAAIIYLLPHLSSSKRYCHHLLTSTPYHHHLGLREEESFSWKRQNAGKMFKYKVWDNYVKPNNVSFSVALSEVSWWTKNPPVWCSEQVKANVKSYLPGTVWSGAWSPLAVCSLQQEKHLIHLEREKGENSEG